MNVLVVDVGTSGVRTASVTEHGDVSDVRHEELLPDSPGDGLVQIDGQALAAAALRLAREAVSVAPADAVAVTNQRASTVVWDADTGEAVGPVLGWQDLRTVGRCLELAADGVRLAPNQTATKAEWLVAAAGRPPAALCVGTIDSWILWHLTEGRVHATDATNASVTGLADPTVEAWNPVVLSALGLTEARMPDIVESAQPLGPATALRGAPEVTSLVGDQQASLVGQGCLHPGEAKITFGTGAMLDVNVGRERPPIPARGEHGSFAVVAWRHGGATVWAVEAAMLAAGTNVEWLRDDVGLIDSVEESHEVAARCADTGGVLYVPALLGLGTPWWDFGARSVFVGITRGTRRPEIVRAVLEGIAHRGVDLVEAAERDGGQAVPRLRIDGGMSRNGTFVQALADAAQRPVEVSSQTEATTLGAGLLGALGAGALTDERAVEAACRAGTTVLPSGPSRRDRWQDAVDRSRGWIPGLSAIEF